MKTFTTLILILISTLSFSQEPEEYKFKADSSEIYKSIIDYANFIDYSVTHSNILFKYNSNIDLTEKYIKFSVADSSLVIKYVHESEKSTLYNLLKFIKNKTSLDELGKVEYDQFMVKLNLKHKQVYDNRATNTLIGILVYNTISSIAISQLPKISNRSDNPRVVRGVILGLNGTINLALFSSYISKKKKANKQRYIYLNNKY